MLLLFDQPNTAVHKILIDKLAKYGVKGKKREWFKSYLNGRKQFWSVNGQKSETEEVVCVIPQGSCFVPLLFFIYLNDFNGSKTEPCQLSSMQDLRTHGLKMAQS